MKLFSRKAIVAGATALAVTFAGTSVAVAEDETPAVFEEPSTDTSTPGNNDDDADADADADTNADADADDDDDDDAKKEEGSSSDPKDITAWISVFTAVIGALGTLFTFANKHFDFMG